MCECEWAMDNQDAGYSGRCGFVASGDPPANEPVPDITLITLRRSEWFLGPIQCYSARAEKPCRNNCPEDLQNWGVDISACGVGFDSLFTDQALR